MPFLWSDFIGVILNIMNKELEEAKKSIRKTRKLLTFLVGLLGVLLFTIIALVVWAVIQEQKTATTFEQCVLDKDARMLESYPEQCVVDGKSFTNPNQKIVLPEPVKDELSSDAWLLYTPDDEAYNIKLADGWAFESYKVQKGGKEVLVGCVGGCQEYKQSTPAELVNKTGRYSGDANLVVSYGDDPVLVATYMPANDIELKNGGTAKKYVYNDGEKTSYLYVVKGKETTVTAEYTHQNTAKNTVDIVEEMISTITTP